MSYFNGTSNQQTGVDTINTNVNIETHLLYVDPSNAASAAFAVGFGAVVGVAVGKAIVAAISNTAHAITMRRHKNTSRYDAAEDADYREGEPEDTNS